MALIAEQASGLNEKRTGIRRLNRKQANQLKEKAYAIGVVSVEVNPHGTSQSCARCGCKGVRFTSQAGQRVTGKGGKLFFCPACHYECHADFNASCSDGKMAGEGNPGDPAQARLQVSRHAESGGGAPRRARKYPWRSQEELGGSFLGQRLTGRRKPEGTTACRKRVVPQRMFRKTA